MHFVSYYNIGCTFHYFQFAAHVCPVYSAIFNHIQSIRGSHSLCDIERMSERARACSISFKIVYLHRIPFCPFAIGRWSVFDLDVRPCCLFFSLFFGVYFSFAFFLWTHFYLQNRNIVEIIVGFSILSTIFKYNTITAVPFYAWLKCE